MAIARHGDALHDDLAALVSQVHPVFMLPPLAASWFGSVLAGRFSIPVAALHMSAIFAAMYTAHVKDGYVDFHVRDEDDDHPLTARGCRLALAGATALFCLCLIGLWAVAGIGAVLLTAPGWAIGYLHAPHLDVRPLTATAGYPTGIGLAILGGYYTQVGGLTTAVVAFALVFVVLLSGVKVIDDAQDYDYDRSIAKRTVAVVLGTRRAHQVAYGLMAAGLLAVLGLAAIRLFPPSAVLAPAAFGIVAVVARRADPETATMLLVRGSYLFLAALVVAVWFRPLS